MGENEQSTYQGGLAGAGTGAAVGAGIGSLFMGVGAAPGAAIGAGVGFIGGALLANASAQSGRAARNKALKAAEAARRASVVRQFGARQQAESLAGLAANRDTRPSSGTQKGSINSQGNPGFLGANLANNGISGTF